MGATVAVEVQELPCIGVAVEHTQYQSVPPFGHAQGRIPIFQQAAHGVGQRAGIALGHKQTGFPIADDLADAADAGSDDGHTTAPL